MDASGHIEASVEIEKTDARTRFEMVRRASAEIEECERAISALSDGMLPAVDRGGGSVSESDPVYGAVVARDFLLDSYRKKRDGALIVVGDGLVIIDALRRVFCKKADVLEMYYVDRMSMREVADEIGIGVATVSRWRDELLTFVDSCPRSYVLSLRFVEKPQDIVF